MGLEPTTDAMIVELRPARANTCSDGHGSVPAWECPTGGVTPKLVHSKDNPDRSGPSAQDMREIAHEHQLRTLCFLKFVLASRP